MISAVSVIKSVRNGTMKDGCRTVLGIGNTKYYPHQELIILPTIGMAKPLFEWKLKRLCEVF